MNWQEPNQNFQPNEMNNHLQAQGFQPQFSPQQSRPDYPPPPMNNYQPMMPNQKQFISQSRPRMPAQQQFISPPSMQSPRIINSPQNYPPQNYPPQNYPPQNYPPQNYPPQNYPPESQSQYYSINESPFNNQFLPNNLFYMNSFYSRQNGSSSKKDNTSSMLQPSVIDRPTYFGQNKSDDDEILDYIRDMIAFDYQLEKLKMQLLSYTDFAISDAFMIFDVNKTGQVSLKELKEGLNKINIYPEDSDLFLLVNRFSRDGNNVLKLFFY